MENKNDISILYSSLHIPSATIQNAVTAFLQFSGRNKPADHLSCIAHLGAEDMLN